MPEEMISRRQDRFIFDKDDTPTYEPENIPSSWQPPGTTIKVTQRLTKTCGFDGKLWREETPSEFYKDRPFTYGEDYC